MIDGSSLEALIVGGGEVAARKATALLDAGARVRFVAPRLHASCETLLAAHPDRAAAVRREYQPQDLAGALLVIAATDVPEVNARVAADARAALRLANVVDAPPLGNCTTPAVHRTGMLTIGVSAGGVPGAAARIRDAIATRFDARYGEAVAALATLRERLLRDEGSDAWGAAASTLLDDGFCHDVESGTLLERVRRWG